MSESHIKCRICDAQVHSIKLHLRDNVHPGVTIEDYKQRFPEAPIYSPYALQMAEKKKAEAQAIAMAGAAATPLHMVSTNGAPPPAKVSKAFHEVFDLGDVPAAKNAKGDPIPVSVLTSWSSPADVDMIPPIDPNHVFEIDLLKDVVMGLEFGWPILNYGFHGSGKTQTLLNVLGRTRRPAIRVQHTINTEEAHIIGQWVVKKGETVFQLGPLPLAMLHGWAYLADEYDFGLPSVLAVYQPVLEGAALYIKDAPPELRLIKPHTNFRFLATGNTNGSGDETGLYQGVQLQNAANYDRFGVVVRQNYMKPELEALVICKQAKTTARDAEKLVAFATAVREAFAGGTMSSTVSPRALIRAAQIGIKRSSYLVGLKLTFINKLGKVDHEAARGVAERIFGTGTPS